MNKKQLRFLTSLGLMGINFVYSWIIIKYPQGSTKIGYFNTILMVSVFTIGALLLTDFYLKWYEKQIKGE